MERFAIVGFGAAGYHALKGLRAVGCDARVEVYTETDLPPYNPMLTTYYVKGAIPYEALFPFGNLETIQKELNLNGYTNRPVTAARPCTTRFSSAPAPPP